jgi:hypothetical protein
VNDDWRTVRLAELLDLERRPVPIRDDRNYEQVTVRIRGRGLVRRGVFPGSHIATKRQFSVSTGQLVTSKIDARNGGFGLVPPELNGAIISGDFLAFDVQEALCLPRYLELYVQRRAFWDECELVSEGSTNRVRLVPEEFLDLEIELPPLEEQERIVAAVRTVDRAVVAHSRRTELLEAAFRAAATELFADLDAPDRRLGDIAELTSGGTPARADAANYGGTIPWVKTGEVRFNHLSDTEEHITERGLASSSAKLLPAGTVLLAMYGQGATRGRSALLRKEMATNQACAAILPSEYLVPEYLFFFLWSRYEAIRMESEGSAQDNLNQGMVADIELPVPTRDAQEEIVRRLATLRRAADSEAAQAKALSRLKSTLIEDLVLGIRSAPEPTIGRVGGAA